MKRKTANVFNYAYTQYKLLKLNNSTCRNMKTRKNNKIFHRTTTATSQSPMVMDDACLSVQDASPLKLLKEFHKVLTLTAKKRDQRGNEHQAADRCNIYKR